MTNLWSILRIILKGDVIEIEKCEKIDKNPFEFTKKSYSKQETKPNEP